MANKLELTWVGKDEPIRVEPRILLEDAQRSYHASQRVSEGDIFDNRLIFGDNLLALKALEAEFSGKVKCVFIDPPYNTGSAFTHYDDGLEHSIWLSLMRDRLEIIKRLLAEDGSLWITIDDNECHYLKVLCDEIFGRRNFVANVVWQKKYGPANDAKWLSDSHDHILVFAKNKLTWKPNLINRTEKQLKDYKNPDNDPRGMWRASDLSVKTMNESCVYPIIGPTGKTFFPPPTRAWVVSEKKFKELDDDNRIWWGKDRTSRPMVKKFLSDVRKGITPETWWPREVSDDNKIAKYESKEIFSGNSFATPKPEKLLQRIIHIATNLGDIVLDSFAGSGTTGAVAHKMGRRWIMVELGDHCHTHIIPRLKRVIDGTDAGGVTKAAGWKGGGGFRYYRLAPTLINEDAFGEAVINPAYDAHMLAAAVALHEGFTYQPDSAVFWKQAKGSEHSYLFVTTRHVNHAFLDSIRSTMADGEHLLIACRSFDAGLDRTHASIRLQKIPQMLLHRCEFGKEDYALNIIHPPVYEDEEEAGDE